jgi:imidazolonepropionase-like amidohydrolase
MRNTLALLVVLLSHGAIATRAEPAESTLAFTDITVIDVENGLALPHMTVVVVGDRIITIGKYGKGALPRNARVIPAKGKYMIPGLWDMHVHLSVGGERSLALLIANGVTGVRDMGGDISLVRTYRQRISAGTLLGPRIQGSAQIIENAKWLKTVQALPIPEIQPYLKANARLGIATPEDARQAVSRLANDGIDTIKIRNSPSREAYLALTEEAKKRGLPVVGHLPTAVGLMDASDAGQKSIEHTDSLGEALDGMTAEQRKIMFDRLGRNGTWFTPTLVAEQYQGASEEVMSPLIEGKTGVHRERHHLVSSKLLDFWRLQNALTKYNSPGRDAAALVAKGIERLREMHRTKVRMLAGTDLGAMLVYPGLAVHDELELLVSRIGMTPAEALQTATINPAIFFGMENNTGSIQAGKTADLVVLDGNPLHDVRNTKTINAVIVSGRYLSKKALESATAQQIF